MSTKHADNKKLTRRIGRACEGCRSKKVKCSGERPQCVQCIEAGIVCIYTEDKRERTRLELHTLRCKVARIRSVVSASPGNAITNQLLQILDEADSEHTPATTASEQTIAAHGIDSLDPFMGYVISPSNPAFLQERPNPDTIRPELLTLDDIIPDSNSYETHVSSSALDLLPGPELCYELVNLAYDYPRSFVESILPRSILLQKYHELLHIAKENPTKVQDWEDVDWLTAFHAVLATGCVIKLLKQRTFTGFEPLHFAHFLRALYLGAHISRPKDIGHVTRIALLSWYLTVSYRYYWAYSMIGIAIRCAITLGLHVPELNGNKDLSDVERLHRVHLWHTLCGFELYLSAATGRPPMIQDADYILDFQRPVDISPDADIVTKYKITVNTLGMSLSAILQKIYFVPARKLTWEYLESVVDSINRELSRWKRSLPDEFKFIASNAAPHTDSTLNSHRNTLACYYYYAVCVANRPLISGAPSKQLLSSRKPFYERSSSLCIIAAHCLITYLPEPEELPHVLLLYPYHILPHCIAHCVSALAYGLLTKQEVIITDELDSGCASSNSSHNMPGESENNSTEKTNYTGKRDFTETSRNDIQKALAMLRACAPNELALRVHASLSKIYHEVNVLLDQKSSSQSSETAEEAANMTKRRKRYRAKCAAAKPSKYPLEGQSIPNLPQEYERQPSYQNVRPEFDNSTFPLADEGLLESHLPSSFANMLDINRWFDEVFQNAGGVPQTHAYSDY
ncbi:hypothetical protein CANCADRAFT_45789 [Tortispora caseinolytica NRRL Y-17796]|uniref:Zn(2)-C6 fungal-type domain-containing protein n=1 Tax=Tortispora caseinolytica NRRL Y-17796 TaxID=767744 RepID=A0A1E4TCI2_9ASCO|nr:hypothetical protein CANCADRAFT_45789 [Tortispora caseinolytica NRRL Y-17796]